MRKSRRCTVGLLGILALLLLVVGLGRPADAQAPKAEFKLKLMGINRTLDPWKLFQDWAQAVEKKTNGRVQFELTSLPELGLGGAETIRVLKTGVVDVAEVFTPVSVDDDGRLEARRIFPLPEEELLSVPLKTDFYEHDATERVGLAGYGMWDVGCGRSLLRIYADTDAGH